MGKRSVQIILSPILILLMVSFVSAQTSNLLKNTRAEGEIKHWQAFGKATVEDTSAGGHAFVLRDGGYFIQDVDLPEGAIGQFAVFIGRASSERIDPNGAITGLPYLYGYMMNAGDPSGGRIYAYLQGQHMLGSATAKNEWGYLSGIFQVPPGAGRIRFFLRQALGQAIPQNGSAARFDDLGLYLFPTEEQARAFVETTTMTAVSIPKMAGPGLTQIHQCTLSLAQAPELYGLRLGMGINEALALFPGSSEEPDIQRAVAGSALPESFGHAALKINPRRYSRKSKFANVKEFVVQILDGRVFSFRVIFNSTQWRDIDQFIAKYAVAMSLPGPDMWNKVQNSTLRYLVCDGLEVRFYFASQGDINSSNIHIVDNVTEKTFNDRRARARDKVLQQPNM
jgi:hypothetical protein